MKHFERNVYLSNLELEEAKKKFFTQLSHSIKGTGIENCEISDALDRITAKPIHAKISSPYFNASAMDGIAVQSKNTYGIDERNPKRLKINEEFIYLDTGDPIKDPYNAVIMIEDVVKIDETTVEIMTPASPWQHIRPVGEDIVAGEMILPSFHSITSVDIGALISGGIFQVEVIKRPRVGIIPTGTEIVETEEEMEDGKIIDSNSRMFEALVKKHGGIPKRYKPVKDDYDLIKNKLLEAIDENDLVIINAGSSAGSEDYTVHIIKEVGELIVHGVAIKPGKPAILGNVKQKPVIGIPGYPVSAYFVFDSFVKPLIFEYLHKSKTIYPEVEATLSKRTTSSLKHLEFVRAKLGMVDNQLIATPLNRGAGVTMSLVKADGIIRIPKHVEGLESGEKVKVELFKNLDDIKNTIVSIGSHDLLLDILGNMLHIKGFNINLESAHVGSLGGLMALKKRQAHIAPIHLLDDRTGTYNLQFLKKYLKNEDVVLIKGVKRIQGFMVKPKNPKNIRTIDDLSRDDIVFVNRQKGSGTRILLDYRLKTVGFNGEDIKGYDREMTTHMAVASAVSSGTADVGVGIKSVANVMNLDFIPIGEEEYDFVTRVAYLEDNKIQKLIEILKSQEFEESLDKLGGYIIERPGIIEKSE